MTWHFTTYHCQISVRVQDSQVNQTSLFRVQAGVHVTSEDGVQVTSEYSDVTWTPRNNKTVYLKESFKNITK